MESDMQVTNSNEAPDGTAAPDDVVVVSDLALGYGDKLVVDGVSFAIPAGRLTCIIGGSGSGKSTLLRSFVGLLAPERGNITLLGQPLADIGEDARATLMGRVGLMFQDGALLNSLTLAQNLAIPLKAHTALADDVVADLVRMKLALVRLEDSGDKLPGELSGGMRKRAGLARALMLDPELVLCDEPSAGLDPVMQADVDQTLLRLRDTLGLTVVVVTHEVESIKAIADRVVLLEGGRIAFDGTLEEALAGGVPSLDAFFSRQADEGDDDRKTSLAEHLTFDDLAVSGA
ncbi:MAG: ATP-binding cassette domain-containing protein [Myxococcota bacterium]